jgi:hypothetical protein
MSTEVVRIDKLVLTISHSPREGYEMLVEMDTDEDAAAVTVNIGNAAGDEVTWEL